MGEISSSDAPGERHAGCWGACAGALSCAAVYAAPSWWRLDSVHQAQTKLAVRVPFCIASTDFNRSERQHLDDREQSPSGSMTTSIRTQVTTINDAAPPGRGSANRVDFVFSSLAARRLQLPATNDTPPSMAKTPDAGSECRSVPRGTMSGLARPSSYLPCQSPPVRMHRYVPTSQPTHAPCSPTLLRPCHTSTITPLARDTQTWALFSSRE